MEVWNVPPIYASDFDGLQSNGDFLAWQESQDHRRDRLRGIRERQEDTEWMKVGEHPGDLEDDPPEHVVTGY